MIILDFGHGTRQYMKGAKQSPDATLFEGEFNRKIGNEVKKRLEQLGYEVVVPTPEDSDVSLTKRVNRINAIAGKNSILVSIHGNAGGNGKWTSARGFSVYVSKNSSIESKRLARCFTDLAMERKMTGNRSIPKEKYWTWTWTTSDIYILKASKCPAILTENFYYDNREDLAYMKSERGFEEIVQLHVDAIQKYYGK